jgi:hypothetical protein
LHSKQHLNDIMKTKSIIIERIKLSDRVLIMFTRNGQIEGINYLQDIDANIDLIADFMHIDFTLTAYVKEKFNQSNFGEEYQDLTNVHPSPDYWEIIDLIDDIIWGYLNRQTRIDELKSEIAVLQSELDHLTK